MKSSTNFVSVFLMALSILLVDSITVITQSGAIEGVMENGVNRFTKIPFAEPPINELRFADPQETEPWDDILNATAPIESVPSCIQTCLIGECETLQSEDCLFLNIFAPNDAEYDTTEYTVMIWIHGGGFVMGTAADVLFDATNFVDFIGDIIIVTINYRLGIFGFLYDNIYQTAVEGNFGFLDQKLAIKWVYDNIEYFGGDQNNIVIFGMSAGAQSVGLHLLYNNEYISGGIMQSAPFGIELRSPDTWYNTTAEFTNLIGCSDDLDKLQCWRSADVDDINSAQTNPLLWQGWTSDVETFTPTVQTELLSNQPIFGFAEINKNIPPYIIGHTKDEMYANFYSTETYLFNDLIDSLNMHFNGDNDVIESILDYYNITNVSSSNDYYFYDFAEIETAASFRCPVQNILSESKQIHHRYYYSFDVVDGEQSAITMSWASECITRSCHSADMVYLFLAPYYIQNDLVTQDTISIGEQMQIFWSNWAKTLNPNDDGDAVWKMYRNGGKNKKKFLRIISVDEYTTDSFYDDTDECDFWDRIGYAGMYHST